MDPKENASKMSTEQRQARRDGIGRSASARIAKSEQLNFRLEEALIQELQCVAKQINRPVGSMVRDWVVDRLNQEKVGPQASASRLARTLLDIKKKIEDCLVLDERAKFLVNKKIANELSAQASESPMSLPLFGTSIKYFEEQYPDKFGSNDSSRKEIVWDREFAAVCFRVGS
jgi:hypothetical protein